MRGVLSGGLSRFGQLMRGFTPGQRVVSVLAIVGLLLGGWIFMSWASTPTYAPLFTGLAGPDASAVVDKLNSSGTPYKLADGGQTVLVPKDEVYSTRITLSGQGIPASTKVGYSLLDKQGLTTSDFQQHVDFVRAMEGELSNTVGAIEGVSQAVVHLALPERDLFAQDQQKPTASVLVTMQPGKQLGSGQVQAITHLVASSVEGLDPASVTVADSTGKVLSSRDSTSGGIAGDTRAEATQAFEDRVSQAVTQMLTPVVGAGHAAVQVSADLDYDKTTTHTETYTISPTNPPLASSSSKETYTGSAANAAGGPLGVPAPAAGAAPGSSSYTKTSDTVNNAPSKVVEDRVAAPGTVKQLHVAVLLDTKTAGTVNAADVTRIVQNAAGLSTQRGDTVEVTRMPFDTSAQQALDQQLAEAKKAQSQKTMTTLIKTGALALLVLAVLVLAFLSSRRDGKRTPLNDEDRAQIEELRKRLALTQAEPRGLEPTAAAQLEAASDAEDLKRVQVRDEIGELVERQPEEVAQLLRGWLADRRS